MNVLIILGLPLLTALAVLLMPGAVQVRRVALAGSALQVAYLLYGILFAGGLTYGYEYSFPLFADWNVWFRLGLDGISLAMILLTSVVVLSGVLVSWSETRRVKEYYFLLLLLGLGAYGFFMSRDLVLLFFFLEIAVIPKYLLIVIWGSGRNMYSANKLALMLMGGSALVLAGLLFQYYDAGYSSFWITELLGKKMALSVQQIVFPLLFTGFGIFSALFPFHTWVPDGHSSAPTAGSMFLAGISMKLGGYGCLKTIQLMPEAAHQYSDWIVILSAIAIIYGAFVTLMQTDFKYLNAYSSISHCGFVLLGLGMLTRTSINGAVMQMISHGFMTALFFAVIGIIYLRSHTRDIASMGGLMRTMPFVSTCLFIAGFCSLGLPGLSGFVAEMTVLVGSWERTGILHRVATVSACVSIVITAVYILRAVGQVAMGPLKPSCVGVNDANLYEKAALLVLILAILCIGLYPDPWMRMIDIGPAWNLKTP